MAFALGVLWMLMLGLGVVSDCQSNVSCGVSCQDDCNTTYYRHLALATAFVAVVAVVAARRLGTRAWMVILLSTAIATVGLIAFR